MQIMAIISAQTSLDKIFLIIYNNHLVLDILNISELNHVVVNTYALRKGRELTLLEKIKSLWE